MGVELDAKSDLARATAEALHDLVASMGMPDLGRDSIIQRLKERNTFNNKAMAAEQYRLVSGKSLSPDDPFLIGYSDKLKQRASINGIRRMAGKASPAEREPSEHEIDIEETSSKLKIQAIYRLSKAIKTANDYSTLCQIVTDDKSGLRIIEQSILYSCKKSQSLQDRSRMSQIESAMRALKIISEIDEIRLQQLALSNENLFPGNDSQNQSATSSQMIKSKAGRRATTRIAVDRFLRNRSELVLRESGQKKPSQKMWAAEIAKQMNTLARSKLTERAVLEVIKCRWKVSWAKEESGWVGKHTEFAN
jgi:hypothetical protein